MPEADKPVEKVKESNPKATSNKPDIEDFEWMQYQDVDNQMGRLSKALINNPFVPIGAGATVVALVCGLYYLRKNNSAKQQFFMRCRVGAQGFTIAAMLGGLFYESAKKESENEKNLNPALKS